MYDVAIIGAGINGTSIAYALMQKGQKVVIFDMNGIAGGGSGAAGAFISPKFSKYGDLRKVLNDAFIYSMDFYEKKFPHLLQKSPLIHIAKNEKDNETLRFFKKTTSLQLNTLRENIYENETVCIDAGIVDASNMCKALCKDAHFLQIKVDSLSFKETHWVINKCHTAKKVILATGAYEEIIKETYIPIRGVWGHRIDVQTSTENKNSLHQEVSISPSKDGLLAIGATHDTKYHPQTTTKPYDYERGREELLLKASRTINLQDVEVIKDYTGLRSGTSDYLPLLGSLVISDKTLANKNIDFERKPTSYSIYDYYPNLYVINGSGGYGFVLAPYLAKQLCEYIVDKKPIHKIFSPARFFYRWAKRR
ncbi:FAD-dependent oxidoreductase [Sulfurimonas sp. SAG-AH-194-I05]|nr:FAD-dependent oxidoreductase [Sulfurimonas sp. SAG-AH-194-I05]MDF1875102.1 FAD-dependent oxidoreductase [Sulfurimonas sp. SAG-AH-194-I05]